MSERLESFQQKRLERGELEIFVVYCSPEAYPGEHVAVRWVIPRGGQPRADREPYAVHVSLEAVREALPPGLVMMMRSPSDPPAVVETWL